MARSTVYLFSVVMVLGLAVTGCKRESEEVAEAPQEPPETTAPEVAAEPETGMTFPLDEIKVWEVDGAVARVFLRGQSVWCNNGGRASGVTYPSLQSDQPIFGSLDLSQAGPSARAYCFVVDQTSGADGQYDLLYLDEDGDGDLTDDEPIKPMAEPPAGLLRGYSGTQQETCFSAIQIPFDFGPAGTHPVELIPRLMRRGQGYTVMEFVPPQIRTGQFQIADQSYRVYLGYRYRVTGRFDQPETALLVAPEGGDPGRWWGGDTLKATHWLGDKYYRFSCSPLGDKLFVRPYEGSLGTFELGRGERDLTTLEMSGSLRSEDTAVAVGDNSDPRAPKGIRTCRIPTGDYYPAYLSLTIGQTRVSVSNNYHTEGRQGRNGPPVAGIKIREDKPYVLDFSNTPEVMFVQPGKDRRVATGDELKVEAVLIDPVLDIMLRRLSSDSGGGRGGSLDPKVVIKRADGEVVAEGVMPFG